MRRRPPTPTPFPYTTLFRSAIVQRDLKRMLAYSGIAHVGYMMIGMLTIRDDSVAAVAVYTITYALMNIGAFSVDRKSTRLNSSHGYISYAVFCLKKKNPITT